MAPLERRAAALGQEAAWRADTQRALEAEIAWLRGARAELERAVAARAEELDRLRGELDRLRGELERLRGELDRLRADRDAAAAAHDRLLEHHREVLRQVLRALEEPRSWLPWKAWRQERRLAALVEALGKEAG